MSCEMTSLSGACVSLPMSIFRTGFEILSVKQCANLETCVKGHSRSFKMVPFKSLGTVSYSHFIARMAVPLAYSEIFSVNAWRDLETYVRGHSRSSKMAPLDRPYTAFCWSATICIALFCTIFFSLTLNNIMTLKSGFKVTEGH